MCTIMPGIIQLGLNELGSVTHGTHASQFIPEGVGIYYNGCFPL